MGDCRQTVATESRSKLRSSSWNLSLASCTYIGSVQFWQRTPGPHTGIRTDDLLRRRRHQGLTRSQKTWEVRAFLPCATPTSSDGHRHRRSIKSTQGVLIEQRSTPEAVSQSGVAPLVTALPYNRRAMVGTDKLVGPPIQCTREVCRCPARSEKASQSESTNRLNHGQRKAQLH